ncbi:sensor histidine kinase [Streptomyces sp. NPDC051684]|uniref:sensor histidine kinase n=1 Tax=Streptomyces sp. NPDC051684 TaxID=3365670 RepID=UPI0037B6F972
MTPPQPRTSQFLHRTTQRVRAYDGRHPLVWDVLVTAVFVTAALTDGAGGWRTTAADPRVAEWLVLLMSLGLSVPLLWRRRHPLPALAVMVATALVSNWTGAWLQIAFAQFVVVFNIALRRSLRTLAGAAALTVLPMLVSLVRFEHGSWDQLIVPQLWSLALVGLAGLAVRSRQDYTRALVDRARQLEVESDQQARLAAAAERARIAREMHDIIGHNLSVITGLADGGSYAAARNPERAGQALTAIATTSRQALTELRRLLDVLGEDPASPSAPSAELAPAPALDDLDSLIDGVRSAGLPVLRKTEGEPAPLPAGLELTVYRVVQEALTNTLKHGGPSATSELLVSYADDAVTVTVTDTGRGAVAAEHAVEHAAARGTGRGLAGMRERTALYQGTLETGPRPAGGWRVRLRIPIPEGPTP